MIKIQSTFSSARDGGTVESIDLDGSTPQVIRMDEVRLVNMAAIRSPVASACIYCNSTMQLSKEHVVPFALGGTLVIFNGSCEACREITQKFENASLNQGSMREARYVSDIQSRTKHASAKKKVAVSLIRNGVEFVENFATEDLPILLSLPCFSSPAIFDSRPDTRIELAGWATLSFGPDLQGFLKDAGVTEMRSEETKKSPVAFAQMIAKIAYGFAWCHGILELLEESPELVKAFMTNPNELGRFVGTKAPPFRQFPGFDFRIEYQYEPALRIVYAEIQVFPDAATPTYIVVIGTCPTHRCWRVVKKRIAANQNS